jgi:serine/threonine-protein kinase
MGAVLYEALTAKLPFSGGTALEVFANALSRDPAPVRELVPGIAPEIEEIVATCLQRDRARRYPSMSTLAKALRVALAP